VAVVQAFAPLVITVAIVGGQAGGGPFLVNAGLIWISLILLAAGCAWLFMNNLKVSTSEFREQLSVARNHHTWIMSVLYIGTSSLAPRLCAGAATTARARFGPASARRPLSSALARRSGPTAAS
jgi:nitrate/nitrite transporter NarK